MDYRSLYLHFECGVCIYGGEPVLDVKRDFLETIARCHQITPEECEASGLRRMAREVPAHLRAADVRANKKRRTGNPPPPGVAIGSLSLLLRALFPLPAIRRHW